MKFAYYNFNEEKEFEVQIDVLNSIDDKYIVKDFVPIDEEVSKIPLINPIWFIKYLQALMPEGK